MITIIIINIHRITLARNQVNWLNDAEWVYLKPSSISYAYLSTSPLHHPMSWQFMNRANRQSHKAISYQVKPVLFSFSSEKSITKLKGKKKYKNREHQKKTITFFFILFVELLLLYFVVFVVVVVGSTALLLWVILEWTAPEKYVIIGKTMTKHTSNLSETERKRKGEFIFSTFWQVPLIILSIKKQRRLA